MRRGEPRDAAFSGSCSVEKIMSRQLVIHFSSFLRVVCSVLMLFLIAKKLPYP